MLRNRVGQTRLDIARMPELSLELTRLKMYKRRSQSMIVQWKFDKLQNEVRPKRKRDVSPMTVDKNFHWTGIESDQKKTG